MTSSRFTGPPVLMVCEVETADGCSIQNFAEATTVIAPTGPLTSVDADEAAAWMAAAPST